MQTWTRTAAWVLTLALVISLFSGFGISFAKATSETQSEPTEQSTSPISELYPEATELLTNIGIMNNSE